MGSFLSSPWPLSVLQPQPRHRYSLLWGNLKGLLSLYQPFLPRCDRALLASKSCLCADSSRVFFQPGPLRSVLSYTHLDMATWASPGHPSSAGRAPTPFSITDGGVNIKPTAQTAKSTDTIMSSRLSHPACKSNPSADSIFILF